MGHLVDDGGEGVIAIFVNSHRNYRPLNGVRISRVSGGIIRLVIPAESTGYFGNPSHGYDGRRIGHAQKAFAFVDGQDQLIEPQGTILETRDGGVDRLT